METASRWYRTRPSVARRAGQDLASERMNESSCERSLLTEAARSSPSGTGTIKSNISLTVSERTRHSKQGLSKRNVATRSVLARISDRDLKERDASESGASDVVFPDVLPTASCEGALVVQATDAPSTSAANAIRDGSWETAVKRRSRTGPGGIEMKRSSTVLSGLLIRRGCLLVRCDHACRPLIPSTLPEKGRNRRSGASQRSDASV